MADDKMAAFHGAGLKRYLLTVMAAAAKAFKHPSIRNPVSLVVTRLVILGPGEEGPQVGPSAAQTLRSFCAWQRGLNTPEDSDPDHFDTAILFTRQVRSQSAPRSPLCPLCWKRCPWRGSMGHPAPATLPVCHPGPNGAGYSGPRSPMKLDLVPADRGSRFLMHLLCYLPTGPVWGLHLRHSGHG